MRPVHSIPCPTCGAEAEEPCLKANGGLRTSVHVERADRYRELSADRRAVEPSELLKRIERLELTIKRLRSALK